MVLKQLHSDSTRPRRIRARFQNSCESARNESENAKKNAEEALKKAKVAKIKALKAAADAAANKEQAQEAMTNLKLILGEREKVIPWGSLFYMGREIIEAEKFSRKQRLNNKIKQYTSEKIIS